MMNKEKQVWVECSECQGVGLRPSDLDYFCDGCQGFGGWWVEVENED